MEKYEVTKKLSSELSDMVSKFTRKIVKWSFVVIILALSSYTIPILFTMLYIYSFNLPIDLCDEYKFIEILFYALSAFAAVGVVLLAYLKASEFIDNQNTNILIEIDRKWSEQDILAARTYIHKLYRESMDLIYPKTEFENPEAIIQKEARSTALYKDLGEKILKLSLSNKENEQREFILILDLLEFMDFIGYLVENERVNINKIKEIFGNNIEFNYQILRRYIELKSSKDSNKTVYYKHFTKLYNMIK